MSKLYLAGFWFLKFIVWLLPSAVSAAFCRALARVYFLIAKKRKHNVLANLNLAFSDSISSDEKLKIAKECYEKFAVYLGANFIKNQNTTKKSVLERVDFKHSERLLSAINSGRGVIVVTAHYGEWELFSLAMAAKFGAVSVVGRRLDDMAMEAILSKNRHQFDIQVIEKSGAARGVLRALKDGRLVGILVDQNTAKSEGVEVEFFSHRALHTPAASVLAQKSGALIVPAYIKSVGSGRSEIEFDEVIDVAVLTQSLGKDEAILQATQEQASSCEAAIRRAPSEYFWFHKRFKHFYEGIYK
ncbi:lipid A biosynthesis lauroyl acyltransferase [Campylobacter sp. 19-13652]|uniref:lipid A biosynthesis lauroyl acyltransferase n=1 Tax=Campylobacter sp. 19-13652 TaxID=2840180 RepID=UPI001C77B441|nr:lipid A biosynthesis lauroyl acyltransferase [Campylobacter sp. 19-13652]BCX80035.1 lipid A biosynthesis lauroyl acyltransferase [Campylobacter sp. 19-13652]